jgi:hypothetical protein
MVSKRDSKKFWENYRLFAGGRGEIFLNSILFRQYLSEFLGCGQSSPVGGHFVHWKFTRTHCCEVYDSVLLRHQPVWDFHCTMFSFYYELYFSRFKEEFQLQALERATTNRKYIGNLIKVYSGLAAAFSHSEIVTHVHNYKNWCEHGTFLTKYKYAARAAKNADMLRQVLECTGTGKAVALPFHEDDDN